MGKALIIKGADFSVNAIEGINLDGKRILTQDNADSTFVGSVTYNSTGVYLNYTTNGGYIFKIYKIFANEVLVIPRQTNKIELFFSDSLITGESGETQPAFSNLPELRVSPSSFIVDKGVTIKGDKDYYLIVSVNHNISNVIYPFPDEIYVSQEYTPNRVLTEENYDSKVVGRYVNNTSNAWGNDANSIGYFYNVQKGETVHIKDNGSYRARYAVFSQNIQTANGKLPTVISTTENEEVNIPITELGCCVYIVKNIDNTNDRFPSELWTYPTPEVEESNE